MPKGGRGPYKRAYRLHENPERKFWDRWFGSFGDGCRRSFLSRGSDITFFDYNLRRWGVSCKMKPLPKWQKKELENNDILSILDDGIIYCLIPRPKLEELLRKSYPEVEIGEAIE